MPLNGLPYTKNTMRKIISTHVVPTPIGPYSQAVVAHGIAYLSGQIPLDPATNQVVPGDVVVQTTRVLDNMKLVLEAAGSSLSHVLKTTVFVLDLNDAAMINEVYGKYFPHDPPARSTVQVARLPRDVRIEIDCIALVS